MSDQCWDELRCEKEAARARVLEGEKLRKVLVQIGIPLAVAQKYGICRLCGKSGGAFTPPDSLVLNYGREYAHQRCLDAQVQHNEEQEKAELRTEVERLRGFVEDQICECHDEWGNWRPRPCERCRLLHGYETWADAMQGAS